MSHGGPGYISSIDDDSLDPDAHKLRIIEDIVEPFDGRNYPDLRGKPKFFIIQACRGSSECCLLNLFE